MPRIGDMTQHDLEQMGQRFYEAKGLAAGEQADVEVDDALEEPEEVIYDTDIYDDLRGRWTGDL